MTHYNIYQIQANNRIQYHVSLKPDKKILFKSQLDNLLEKLDCFLSTYSLTISNLVFAKIFVSDSLNQKDDMKTHVLFADRFKQCGFSIIEQPPLDGSKINILLWFVKGEKINKYRFENAFYLEMDNYVHIFHCVRYSRLTNSSIEDQTKDLFDQHKALISKYNMNFLNNCVRTWLYIRDIDKDYSCVVKGRNDFFNQNGLTKNTHFIASTGIGGSDESPSINAGIDFYSIKGLKQEQVKYLEALDFLNPTHEYGVSFERGVCITYSDIKHIFISGTASIDKYGNCIHQGNVMEQLKRIFANIKALLNIANADLKDIAQMIVYVRDIADYEEVYEFISSNYSETPWVIVAAKVCRPEWLVEVECLALKKLDGITHI